MSSSLLQLIGASEHSLGKEGGDHPMNRNNCATATGPGRSDGLNLIQEMCTGASLAFVFQGGFFRNHEWQEESAGSTLLQSNTPICRLMEELV